MLLEKATSLIPPPPPMPIIPWAKPGSFLQGDVQHFMGKPYVINISGSDRDEAEVASGRILLRSQFPDDPGHNRWIFNHLLVTNASEEFNEILEKALLKFKRLGIDRPELLIKPMHLRVGGALAHRNRIYLNLDLIKVSRRCIEYVIYHELCHLVHPDHGDGFYECLREMMPDWRYRKRKLARMVTRLNFRIDPGLYG